MEERAGHAILVLLNEAKPAFQLQSGTAELSSSEAYFTKSGRDTAAITRASYASSDEVLKFLAGTIEADWVTLETGGGRSTCVFGALSKRHYCVNPDLTANDLIKRFLEEHRMLRADLEFLSQPSDRALPLLPTALAVDLALIDGNHSFPMPIIDWHYIDGHLRTNGWLLVDDAHIRSVGLLTDFLATEKAYARDRTIGATSVWRKVLDTRIWGWAAQPMNQSNRRLERLTQLRRGLTRRVRRLIGQE